MESSQGSVREAGWFSMIFHGSRSVFMVFHGSRSVFIVFHDSRLLFHGSMSLFVVFEVLGWFFMVPDPFFMVQGWFFMVFLQNVPAQTVSWPSDPV